MTAVNCNANANASASVPIPAPKRVASPGAQQISWLTQAQAIFTEMGLIQPFESRDQFKTLIAIHNKYGMGVNDQLAQFIDEQQLDPAKEHSTNQSAKRINAFQQFMAAKQSLARDQEDGLKGFAADTFNAEVYEKAWNEYHQAFVSVFTNTQRAVQQQLLPDLVEIVAAGAVDIDKCFPFLEHERTFFDLLQRTPLSVESLTKQILAYQHNSSASTAVSEEEIRSRVVACCRQLFLATLREYITEAPKGKTFREFIESKNLFRQVIANPAIVLPPEVLKSFVEGQPNFSDGWELWHFYHKHFAPQVAKGSK